jgi:hypothetical protein
MSMTSPKLSVVKDEPIDIGELMRAERDDPARWQRVHEEGDKNPPLPFWTQLRRGWR